MQCHWISIAIAACLVSICLAVAGQTYQVVSREFTVGMGAAISGDHVRTIVSREFTVGMGAATSGDHVRTIVSREFTVGVGEEVIDVCPAVDSLAGMVTLSNGSQFLRDAASATLDWRIVGPDGRVVAAGQGVPLDDFAYQWNTRTLPDGTYAVLLTVSRPGHDDLAGRREYQLVNQEYSGDGERVLHFSLASGWNLLALPFRVDAADAEALLALHPMYCGSVAQAYFQSGESLPAGRALWVYSDEALELPVVTRHALEAPSVLPQFSRPGWQLAGLCGDRPLEVDCTALDIAAIWRWNGFFLEDVPIATNGLAYLEPQTGYFLEVK